MLQYKHPSLHENRIYSNNELFLCLSFNQWPHKILANFHVLSAAAVVSKNFLIFFSRGNKKLFFKLTQFKKKFFKCQICYAHHVFVFSLKMFQMWGNNNNFFFCVGKDHMSSCLMSCWKINFKITFKKKEYFCLIIFKLRNEMKNVCQIRIFFVKKFDTRNEHMEMIFLHHVILRLHILMNVLFLT